MKGKVIYDKHPGGECMEKESLAFHETMEAHEILNFKTICLMRSKLMQGICFDNDLKALMEKDVQQSIAAINELKGFYTGARTNTFQ
jgi:similar to spore coat protein